MTKKHAFIGSSDWPSLPLVCGVDETPYPEPPDEILECARKLELWMNQNGHRHWQLLGVCDRSFAIRLEKIMDVLTTWSK